MYVPISPEVPHTLLAGSLAQDCLVPLDAPALQCVACGSMVLT